MCLVEICTKPSIFCNTSTVPLFPCKLVFSLVLFMMCVVCWRLEALEKNFCTCIYILALLSNTAACSVCLIGCRPTVQSSWWQMLCLCWCSECGVVSHYCSAMRASNLKSTHSFFHCPDPWLMGTEWWVRTIVYNVQCMYTSIRMTFYNDWVWILLLLFFFFQKKQVVSHVSDLITSSPERPLKPTAMPLSPAPVPTLAVSDITQCDENAEPIPDAPEGQGYVLRLKGCCVACTFIFKCSRRCILWNFGSVSLAIHLHLSCVLFCIVAHVCCACLLTVL